MRLSRCVVVTDALRYGHYNVSEPTHRYGVVSGHRYIGDGASGYCTIPARRVKARPCQGAGMLVHRRDRALTHQRQRAGKGRRRPIKGGGNIEQGPTNTGGIEREVGERGRRPRQKDPSRKYGDREGCLWPRSNAAALGRSQTQTRLSYASELFRVRACTHAPWTRAQTLELVCTHTRSSLYAPDVHDTMGVPKLGRVGAQTRLWT